MDAPRCRQILYNWRGVGWCEGIIILRNDKKKHTIDGDVINFYVHYEARLHSRPLHLITLG